MCPTQCAESPSGAAPTKPINEWQRAVEEACIVLHLSFEGEPKKVLNNLIAYEVSIALDPRVSEAARKLIDLGRAGAGKDAQYEMLKQHARDHFAADTADKICVEIEKVRQGTNADTPQLEQFETLWALDSMVRGTEKKVAERYFKHGWEAGQNS